MNDLKNRLEPSVELARVMDRVREIVRGPSAVEPVDEASTERVRTWLPAEETTEHETFQAALASQAEFNRHILGMVNGLFEHLKGLEESLNKFDRYLARQERNVDFSRSTAPRRDDGDGMGGL
jgi:hypothetical protein